MLYRNLRIDESDGRIKYDDNGTEKSVATLTDLIGLGGNAVNTEGLVLKVLLQDERTYYVRQSSNFGNSGETEADAFAAIEEALIVLSNKYEISGHLIFDLGDTHTLNCWYLPAFTGSGQITFKGNNTTITFVAYQGSTEAYFTNWSALTLNLEGINFVKGDCTKLIVEGGKMSFDNVDFGELDVDFDNCRSTSLNQITNGNNGRLRFYRSNLNVDFSQIAAEYYYCQVSTINCTYKGIFIVEACNIILRNPRLNNRWWTVTSKIVNTTIEFKSTWLTFENLGGDPQTKTLLSFQNCNLKDFPSNIDVQGNRTFWDTSILKYVNCQTPEEFNNVNYNFSAHTFSGGASAIRLVNTAFLKNINISGATIERDPFSILGGINYDNSTTGIPANTLQEAIDYLFTLINP
ncbi:MAG: hypothetical protein QNJ41_12075 [Xenococcaceae cyanobacterium MO_188.B32]|nr:hypothetical protein [Xenococcaceae cyanobacterium MO_188.B32]